MSQSNTKNEEASEEAGQSSIAASAAATVPIQQTGDIFKLDIDCFEEAFDFLPLEELVSVGSTCKRLQHVAGYCFQQNYAAITKVYNDNGMSMISFHVGNVNCFIPFINRIVFESQKSLEMFRSKQSKFMRLKEMMFQSLEMTSTETECVKDKLNKVEVLRLHCCKISGDFYEMILKFCINLKRLIIVHAEQSSIFECSWMLKNYPKLEHFGFETIYLGVINELIPFFELNPTIRIFSVLANFLWYNREAMASGKIKLDDLAVLVTNKPCYKYHEFYEYLNELHDKGVYKRLHLYFPAAKQELIDRMVELKMLTKLYFGLMCHDITLPILNDLQEIYVCRSRDIINFEDLGSKFTNLERVHLEEATSTDLLMFISRRVNLMKIRVDCLSTGLHFDENDKILDLVALNKERQKLNEAEKCIIYVVDNIYLPTKWAMKGTDLSHIVMRRAESHDWKHSFFHKLY